MSSLCEQVKIAYERLQSLTECYLLEYEKIKAGDSLTSVRKIKNELETAYRELESKITVSINEARELLGEEMVLGPEEITNALGFEVEESEIPLIPYSRDELEKAKKLGDQLILHVSHDGDGNPMTMKRINEIMETRMDPATEGKLLNNINWYKDEDFYKREKLKTEWRLVGSAFVPDVSSPKDEEGNHTKDTRNNNYVHQTRLLREYLESVGKDILTEEEEEECSDRILQRLSEQMGVDWDTQKITNQEKYNKNWREVAEKLVSMQINQNHRRSMTEIIYDWTLRFKKSKDRGLLRDYYEWSRSPASAGGIVRIGDVSSYGADVVGWLPVLRSDSLGVVSSR
jgi:hypothetical protein